MARAINKKIAKLLKERGFKKKDLAEAMGISVQALNDILEGRTQITVSGLKALVKFFGIRADYWINDEKNEPTREDFLENHLEFSEETLKKYGIKIPTTGKSFGLKIKQFILEHPEEWTAQFGPLTREEMEILEEMEKEPE